MEHVEGFEGVVLENSRIRAVILPELGGRIWELHDLARARQWVWHRDGVALAPAAPGSSYDDVWAGGWEELFPNDAPGEFEGRALFDHGEWWASSWRLVEISGGDTGLVRLAIETGSPRTRCIKEVRLGASARKIEISYRIESREPEAFHFLFKLHYAVAITPSSRLRLPGGLVTPVEAGFGTLLREAGPYEWPMAGSVDLTRIPARSGTAREFLYVTDLPQGWCGVDDERAGATLRVHYDSEKLPFVWLFLSYGGWRECYTAVLEPCTNLPKDLSQAVRCGTSACLAPGETFSTSVTIELDDWTTTR
jgi:hypothetical protein